ncbi:Cro/CI family transcriptional regulator [Sansalvadorimonas verongulae]|uniref:Cro/CI family transcriptional regulator n=1 Tax=Sansalvadorimonas verongulae TaxID=2172824 RepID=UPI0012BD5784|nr:transcriptional regulator [Sansalvadorimonas verongulae]
MNTYQKLLKRFDGNKSRVAKALGISQPAVTQWKGVIPRSQADRVDELTGGEISIAEIVRDHRRARQVRDK